MSDSSSGPTIRNGHDVLKVVSNDERLAYQRQDALRDALLRRAAQLPLRDQRVIALALTGRHTYRQIAGLLGMNPGAVHRRAKALEKRLTDPLVVALLEWPVGLAEKYRDVGLDRHLLGKSMRTIARERDMAEADVRTVIDFLPDWLRLAREKARAAAARH